MYHKVLRNRLPWETRYGRIASIAGFIALVGCSGPPPARLFLLNSGPLQVPGERAMLSSGSRGLGTGPTATGGRPTDVFVTIPQYLDRPEIMVRTDAFELKPLPDAKWGEDLAMTTSRTLAEDLNRLVPQYDIVAAPNRFERPVAYRINVNLTRFEMDSSNQVVIAGRWSIIDNTSEKERASANFQQAAFVATPDATFIVKTMSGLLGNVGTEIAAALERPQTVGRR